MAPIINRGLPRILRSGYVTKRQGEPNKIRQKEWLRRVRAPASDGDGGSGGAKPPGLTKMAGTLGRRCQPSGGRTRLTRRGGSVMGTKP
jgi:hypothetical protein